MNNNDIRRYIKIIMQIETKVMYNNIKKLCRSSSYYYVYNIRQDERYNKVCVHIN